MRDTAASPGERLRVLQDQTAPPTVDMVRDGGRVVCDLTLPDRGTIGLDFSAVRRERTGVHARLTFLGGENCDRVLAWNVLNVERDEDRLRMVNSAARALGLDRDRVQQLKLRVDLACLRVWDVWIAGEAPTWVAGDPSEPVWLLEPWLVKGAGTILFGDPKAGKSNVALLWALALTYGQAPFRVPSRCNVLFVNLERPADAVARRLHRLATVLGCPASLLVLNRRGSSLVDVSDTISETVAREQVGLVVLDSLSRAGAGNLNDNEPANRAMDLLNGLGCTWLAIGHTGHENKTRLFGSMMFAAAADLQVRVTSTRSGQEGDDQPYSLGLLLEPRDGNDVRACRPQTWALDFGPGNQGVVGFRRAGSDEFLDLTPLQRSGREQIREYLLREGKASAGEIAEEVGLNPDTVSRLLRRHDNEFVPFGDPSAGRGRRRLWAVKADSDPAV